MALIVHTVTAHVYYYLISNVPPWIKGATVEAWQKEKKSVELKPRKYKNQRALNHKNPRYQYTEVAFAIDIPKTSILIRVNQKKHEFLFTSIA
jgi:hypothetical protein